MKLWRGQPDNWKWKPSTRDTARLLIGFGAFFYVLGFIALVEPSGPPTGQRPVAQFRRAAYEILGPSSDVILCMVLGTFLLVCGLLKYRSDEQTGL